MFCPHEVRLQTYVDDPCSSVGNSKNRNKFITMIILCWLALGFKLAFAKSKRGQRVDWISNRLTAGPGVISIALKPEILEDVSDVIRNFENKHILSLKELQVFADTCNHIASVVPPWQPFLNEIWAAIAQCLRGGDGRSRAPGHCVAQAT